MQSLVDEFELPKTNHTTPAVPKNVLTKAAEELALDGKDQTKYRSGVGKLLHIMQYSRPEILNAVRDLARHMTKAAPYHTQAMLRCMNYMVIGLTVD